MLRINKKVITCFLKGITCFLIIFLTQLAIADTNNNNNNGGSNNDGHGNGNSNGFDNGSNNGDGSGNNSMANQSMPTDVQHAPSVSVVPNATDWRKTNQLFNQSEYKNLDKQKTVQLFDIPK